MLEKPKLHLYTLNIFLTLEASDFIFFSDISLFKQ